MLEKTDFDVVVIGTGPAGLQAAIHAARKKVSVLVMGKETKSSLFHAHVENFCCLFNVSGEEMLDVGRQQATNFGSILLDEDVAVAGGASAAVSGALTMLNYAKSVHLICDRLEVTDALKDDLHNK
jgi:thioredoxin reductase